MIVKYITLCFYQCESFFVKIWIAIIISINILHFIAKELQKKKRWNKCLILLRLEISFNYNFSILFHWTISINKKRFFYPIIFVSNNWMLHCFYLRWSCVSNQKLSKLVHNSKNDFISLIKNKAFMFKSNSEKATK